MQEVLAGTLQRQGRRRLLVSCDCSPRRAGIRRRPKLQTSQPWDVHTEICAQCWRPIKGNAGNWSHEDSTLDSEILKSSRKHLSSDRYVGWLDCKDLLLCRRWRARRSQRSSDSNPNPSWALIPGRGSAKRCSEQFPQLSNTTLESSHCKY